MPLEAVDQAELTELGQLHRSHAPASERAAASGSGAAATALITATASAPAFRTSGTRSSVIFDLGGDSLVRIPTLEPLRGSKAHVGALLDSVDSAVALVEQLTT